MNNTLENSFLRKILLLCTITVVMLTALISYQSVNAYTGVNYSVNPVQNSALNVDFYSLTKMLNRNANSIRTLTKNRTKIMAMVDRLRNKNDKKWVEMRILYYDYNSSYQLAIEHVYEGKLLVKNHPGFTASGKVENESMAKWTVQRLRGAVSGLIARINECNSIMSKANRLLKTK